MRFPATIDAALERSAQTVLAMLLGAPPRLAIIRRRHAPRPVRLVR